MYIYERFNHDVHSRELDCSGMEGEGTTKADGPVKPGHPLKPFAYVKPIRCETPAFTAHHRERSQGHRGRRSQQAPGAGLQELPNASGYWVLTNSPTSSIYPCLGFRPLEGSTLLFTQTPSGTFVYGVPEFFTHIAH
ncbi:proline-rich protein 20E-like [Neomonachus schauinslandi]|uniref:Proline-rich protein 20E-like n=1 Tax=Neomonachus schauinslandi TaxID=29088 RepID=A0A2Y9HGN9_NEOSC|nr:proline-rich protein 20E-like [Neomonachus schauinslandi]